MGWSARVWLRSGCEPASPLLGGTVQESSGVQVWAQRQLAPASSDSACTAQRSTVARLWHSGPGSPCQAQPSSFLLRWSHGQRQGGPIAFTVTVKWWYSQSGPSAGVGQVGGPYRATGRSRTEAYRATEAHRQAYMWSQPVHAGSHKVLTVLRHCRVSKKPNCFFKCTVHIHWPPTRPGNRGCHRG